jgi:hypothetical protein
VTWLVCPIVLLSNEFRGEFVSLFPINPKRSPLSPLAVSWKSTRELLD